MRNKFRLFFLFIGRFTLFSLSFSVLLVLVLKWLPVAWTPLMFFREMGDKIPEKTPIRHQWVSYDEIDASMPLAVVCTEDQRFLTHNGFDWESINEAWEKSESGKRSGGASSISQQTAKNVFCWPTSSFIRKVPETWFTFLIEAIWGKERILEVYLNSIEFGPGIYGCEAASLYYFDKHAAQLSKSQSARLAVVLPNPLEYKANATKGYVVTHMQRALGQMANYGYDIELTRVNGKEEVDDTGTSSNTR